MKKRIVSILLAFLMVVGILPGAATAAESEPKVVVNGVDLVSEADHIIECGSGTAVFDPATKTLTLTNAEITSPSTTAHKAGVYFEAFSASDTVTINLVGENRITLSDTTNNYNGIWNDSKADLLITGTGSLHVLTYNDNIPYGISNSRSNLSIENAELTFSLVSGSSTAGSASVYAKEITLNGVKLTASGYYHGW